MNCVYNSQNSDMVGIKKEHELNLYYVHSQMLEGYFNDCINSLQHTYETCVYYAMQRNSYYCEYDDGYKEDFVSINHIIDNNIYVKLKFDHLQKRLEHFERLFPYVYENKNFTEKELKHLKKLFKCKLPSVIDKGVFYDNRWCDSCEYYERCGECDEQNDVGKIVWMKPYDLAVFIYMLKHRDETFRIYCKQIVKGRKIFDKLTDFPDISIQEIKSNCMSHLLNRFMNLEFKKRMTASVTAYFKNMTKNKRIANLPL